MDFDSVAEDAAIARAALAHYAFGANAGLRMINLSENATFMVEAVGVGVAVLRVHRRGYHTRAQIESELAWLGALGSAPEVRVAEPIANTSHELVTTVQRANGERYVVLFELIDGEEPDEGTLSSGDFEMLGAITARLHDHAQAWLQPPNFQRFSWDWRHSLGEQPRWGRWEEGIAVGEPERAQFGKAAQLVRERLAEYGQQSDRYGLVHADLRLANLMRDKDGVTIIDFDDCGLSWFMYDFGAAVSFLEHDERLDSWQTAWVKGYRTVRELSEEHERMLPTFVMMRRLLLIAWMGTHSHARECQLLGPGYTAATWALAESYLASEGDSIQAT